MAEANNPSFIYARLIANNVNLTDNRTQDIEDYYKKFGWMNNDGLIIDHIAKNNFDKFMKNNDRKAMLGADIKYGGGGKKKHLQINVGILNVFLASNNINYNNDNNDNNDNDNNDDDNNDNNDNNDNSDNNDNNDDLPPIRSCSPTKY
jgi:hypothetical protein